MGDLLFGSFLRDPRRREPTDSRLGPARHRPGRNGSRVCSAWPARCRSIVAGGLGVMVLGAPRGARGPAECSTGLRSVRLSPRGPAEPSWSSSAAWAPARLLPSVPAAGTAPRRWLRSLLPAIEWGPMRVPWHSSRRVEYGERCRSGVPRRVGGRSCRPARIRLLAAMTSRRSGGRTVPQPSKSQPVISGGGPRGSPRRGLRNHCTG